MTPSKRALARQTESPSSLKKRKQLTMDDYGSTVSTLAKYLLVVEVACCVFTEAAHAIVAGKKEKVNVTCRKLRRVSKGWVGF